MLDTGPSSGVEPVAAWRMLVFARAPIPGQAKTRLIPALGADGAAQLQGLLIRHTLATVNAAAPAITELWCSPDTGHALFAAAAQQPRLRCLPQGEGDLGQRMAMAFRDAFRENSTAVIGIGTDCPALTAAHLHRAAEALTGSHDAVFIPAEDGGYVLIGLKHWIPSVFTGIDWGTGQVMAQTRLRLQSAGASWLELGQLWDVDRPEDLSRLPSALRSPDFSFPEA